MSTPEPEPLLFVVATPLGFLVRTSAQYWQKVVTKHPDLQERLEAVKQTLLQPTEVRQSRHDAAVVLFYTRTNGYWLVAVARRLNSEGFLVTAYRTDAIKEGKRLWPR